MYNELLRSTAMVYMPILSRRTSTTRYQVCQVYSLPHFRLIITHQARAVQRRQLRPRLHSGMSQCLMMLLSTDGECRCGLQTCDHYDTIHSLMCSCHVLMRTASERVVCRTDTTDSHSSLVRLSHDLALTSNSRALPTTITLSERNSA